MSRFFVSAWCALLLLPALVHAQATAEDRAALQAQLNQIEQEIAQNTGALTELQKERTTLERDVAILDNKIKAAQLQIRQSDIALAQLRNDIADKQAAIGQVDSKVERGQESLAQILRKTREIDDTSLASVILSNVSLSDAFRDIDSFQTLQNSLSNAFAEMAAVRSDLSDRQRALQEKQEEAQKVREVQVLARNAVQRDEQEKQRILKATKGQEATYQALIADKRRQASEIRVALFGLRDSEAIPFGTAYQYAKEASAKTGVRPALILAVLRQETNLGANVGQCLVTNSPSKGDGKGKNTGTPFRSVMKPNRDVDPFMQITSELGIDPYAQVVSCPQSGGYGGAMGPAQFIPSTWLLYKDRLAKITGENPPNPWSARTAVFATALLMSDNGADAATRAAERLAALRYFAGWANAGKRAYAFYGDSVISFADEYQRDI